MNQRRITLTVGVAAIAVCVAMVVCIGDDLMRAYYAYRLSTDENFFEQAVEDKSANDLRHQALLQYLQLDSGKEALFHCFYNAVVQKYPWFPQEFDIGLHGVFGFGPDGKIQWTMRVPGNVHWNNQDPTPRLEAVRRHLDFIQGLEFRLDAHPGWRFVMCGDSPVEVPRELTVRENACVLIGPRTPYPDLFENWVRNGSFRLVSPVETHD